MTTATTFGIRISVDTTYRDMYSNPMKKQFLFAYRVTIKNESEDTVQLLRRHWHIYDSNGEYREVEGAGVIGHQPVLHPGGEYTYESACNLVTGMGKMKGTYLMERLDDGKLFRVNVPEFLMVLPWQLN